MLSDNWRVAFADGLADEYEEHLTSPNCRTAAT
ncbi:hypothetical protein [Marinobacter psychrophilus]